MPLKSKRRIMIILVLYAMELTINHTMINNSIHNNMYNVCMMFILPLTTTAYDVEDTDGIVMLVLKICITLK